MFVSRARYIYPEHRFVRGLRAAMVLAEQSRECYERTPWAFGRVELRKDTPVRVGIRPFREEDIAICAELMATSTPWDRYGVTQSSAEAMFRGPRGHGARIRVATLNGRTVGFIWFSIRGAFYYGGYIHLVGVVSAFRRRGVGQALMATAEREVFAKSRSLFLLVSDFNHAAHRFYESRGYKKVGELPDYVVDGITEYIYHKARPENT
jgi:ribosomal protein S18 acetylase RimI-like enzyme